MAKFGMAIDLNKCVGCGACALACKTENNTEQQQLGTKFNWADFLTFTTGTFPNTKYEARPVLCNHCSNAACVAACPVTPDVNGHKAMYKTADNVTMHDDSRCIGCQMCQDACPYSSLDVVANNKQYSVISYNEDTGNPTHAFWAGTTAVIANGTSTPSETVTAAGITPPYCNNYVHTDYNAVRPSNVTEKCYFCDHRRQLDPNAMPYCVDSCPAGARIFGDLNDTNSSISLAIANGYHRLANNDGNWLTGTGTDPNVYYIGEFGNVNNVAPIQVKVQKKINIYPNPVSDFATIDFELENSGLVTITVYNISGRDVRKITANEFKLAGNNKVQFNVNGLSAGTYICVVNSGKETQSANFIVAK